MAIAFVAVGANLEPQKNIRAALQVLCQVTRVVASSTFYRTAPLGGRDQPEYINGVWQIETALSAPDVKSQVLAPVEQQLGRTRTHDKCAPRTIDLDLILYDDLVVDDPDLKVPHPDILRPFVYFPVVELLEEMSGECGGDLAGRIRQLLPAPPAASPGEPLSEFTQELRGLLDRSLRPPANQEQGAPAG